jgi:hypothetical protein
MDEFHTKEAIEAATVVEVEEAPVVEEKPKAAPKAPKAKKKA